MDPARQLKKVRIALVVFMIGLMLSGLTAFPLETELRIAASVAPQGTALAEWLIRVRDAVIETNAKYPFLAYGTDWLAFAHLVIAVAFVGPLRDPVKNIWVIQFGLIACAMVIPLALIAGPIRSIPIGWQLIDCSFGVIGAIPLWIAYRCTRRLEQHSRGLAPQ
jgi:hypothetical protein